MTGLCPMRRTSYERIEMKNQHIIRMPKPGRFKKGVLLSSEPLYLLEFCRKNGERCLMELTKLQILDLLEEDHTDTSTGIHRRRRELEEKRGEIMKKRRRLRKPIRWVLRFVCYAVAAIVADLTVIGAILYYFGDMYIMTALGVCLGVNILTEYFFFKDEFRRKQVQE